MNPDVVAAFFSGMGAIASALVSLHVARKRAEKDCARRIKEIKEAIHEGWEMGEHHE